MQAAERQIDVDAQAILYYSTYTSRWIPGKVKLQTVNVSYEVLLTMIS